MAWHQRMKKQKNLHDVKPWIIQQPCDSKNLQHEIHRIQKRDYKDKSGVGGPLNITPIITCALNVLIDNYKEYESLPMTKYFILLGNRGILAGACSYWIDFITMKQHGLGRVSIDPTVK